MTPSTRTSARLPSTAASAINHAARPQRRASEGERVEDRLGNRKLLALLRAGQLRTKREVRDPGDALERQADRAAEAIESGATAQITAASATTMMSRKCGCAPGGPPCDCPVAQLHEHRSSQVDQVLGSSGRPLDDSVRAHFEPAFGRDLSHVEIHTDTAAAASAATLQSAAYTVGNHIAFGAGRYNPTTRAGRLLLGHELAHVVQNGGRSRADSTLSRQSLGAQQNDAVAPEVLSIPVTFIAEPVDGPLDAGLGSPVPISSGIPLLDTNSRAGPIGQIELAPLPASFLGPSTQASDTEQRSPFGLPGYPLSTLGWGSNVLASGDLSWLFEAGGTGWRSRAGAAARVFSGEYWGPLLRGGAPPRGWVALDRLVDVLPRDLAPLVETELAAGGPLSWVTDPYRGFTEAQVRSVPDLVRRWNQGGQAALTAEELALLRRVIGTHIGGTTPGAPVVSYMRPNHTLVSVGERVYRVRVEMPGSAALDVSGPNAFNEGGTMPDITNVEEAEWSVVANQERRIVSVERTNGPRPSWAMRNAGAIRWGGRILLVGGLGVSAYRIATAPPEQRNRVIGQETGGQVGGFLGTGAGVAGCVLFGIASGGWGLFVCGLAGGVGGGMIGSSVGGGVVDTMENISRVLEPPTLLETTTLMFGTPDQINDFYEMREIMGGEPSPFEVY